MIREIETPNPDICINRNKDMKVTAGDWITVCSQSDLVDNSGVCALLPTHLLKHDAKVSDNNEVQIALFYVKSLNKVFATSNYDPIGKANVIYRGIIGSISEEIVVASPLYKQHFSLETGRCLEDETVSLSVFTSRIKENMVQLRIAY